VAESVARKPVGQSGGDATPQLQGPVGSSGWPLVGGSAPREVYQVRMVCISTINRLLHCLHLILNYIGCTYTHIYYIKKKHTHTHTHRKKALAYFIVVNHYDMRVFTMLYL